MSTPSYGHLHNFFSISETQILIDAFNKLESSTGYKGNNYIGIGPEHLGYFFVQRHILSRIQKEFNIDAKLIFAFYLNCIAPVLPHQDLHKLPAPGTHWRSFLIPYAVDMNPSLCHNASTIILNQFHDTNNLLNYKERLCSHVKDDDCKLYGLEYNAIWNTGDLIWWNSQVMHLSNNFLDNGCKSKQGIVIHTYLSR